MLINITMGWLHIHNFYMLATCQVRSFNAPTYSQSVLVRIIENITAFPAIKQFSFCFYWL